MKRIIEAAASFVSSEVMTYRLRGYSILEAVLFLLLLALFILGALIGYNDILKGRFPWVAIVIYGGVPTLIASIFAWHTHQRLHLALARRIDPEIDGKIEDFLEDVKAALLPGLIPDNWFSSEVHIRICLRWSRQYRVNREYSMVTCKAGTLGFDHKDWDEFSEFLKTLSRQTFGRTNHWLISYWFSREDLRMSCEALSMHQIIALHRKKRDLMTGLREQVAVRTTPSDGPVGAI